MYTCPFGSSQAFPKFFVALGIGYFKATPRDTLK